MFDKIIVPLIVGIISSLLANWLTSSWSSLDSRYRLLLSIAIGGIAFVTALIASRSSSGSHKRKAMEIASKIKSEGSVKIESVDVTPSAGETKVASDIDSKGDVTITGINVGKK